MTVHKQLLEIELRERPNLRLTGIRVPHKVRRNVPPAKEPKRLQEATHGWLPILPKFEVLCTTICQFLTTYQRKINT